MTLPSQGDMHAQHTEWRTNLEGWHDDTHTWRVQHAQTMANLTRLSADLQRHGAELLEHAEGLRKARHQIKSHEHELAELSKAGAGDQADPQLKDHEENAGRMDTLQSQHEKIKARHRQVVAKLEKLIRELEA
jgi:hypothetical protein